MDIFKYCYTVWCLPAPTAQYHLNQGNTINLVTREHVPLQSQQARQIPGHVGVL